jgi:D-arginine dehydrogenase
MHVPGDRFEIIIIGGGIAGASLAYFLARRGITDVLLLEREAQPGYHATGRSAASLVEWDRVPALRELKAQAARFFRDPPAKFSEHPVLTQSGVLVTFQEVSWREIRPVMEHLQRQGAAVYSLSVEQTLARVPVLSRACFDGGLWFPEDGRLDVHELLWSYLRHAHHAGVQRRFDTEVIDVLVDDGRAAGVVTQGGTLRARWIVDAAGAWAGRVGRMANATVVPVTPHRRTIATFATPEGLDVSAWPLTLSESPPLYFAPEAGGLLVCPMDEDPMEPHDAHPDELRVAEAIERLEHVAPALVPATLRRTWAGLRTFTPDRVPVVGEDPRVPGFFWLAGQGGCGIETSPAVGQIAADLLVEGRTDRFDAARLSPARFE